MQKLLQAGAMALALTGFALGGNIAPADAATFHYGTPGAQSSVHINYGQHHRDWRWSRHRVKVCTVQTHWRHHHRARVRTCRWEWQSNHSRYGH